VTAVRYCSTAPMATVERHHGWTGPQQLCKADGCSFGVGKCESRGLLAGAGDVAEDAGIGEFSDLLVDFGMVPIEAACPGELFVQVERSVGQQGSSTSAASTVSR
jgi:hypothetical protein